MAASNNPEQDPVGIVDLFAGFDPDEHELLIMDG
jgi:hypothetical protein